MFSPASAITPPSTPRTKIATDVEQGDQRQQLFKRTDTIFPDRIGDCAEHAEHAEPRETHDQTHRTEQHRRYGIDERRDFFTPFAADESQADAEDDREEQSRRETIRKNIGERKRGPYKPFSKLENPGRGQPSLSRAQVMV